jgi:hypothetical protein
MLLLTVGRMKHNADAPTAEKKRSSPVTSTVGKEGSNDGATGAIR